MTFFKGLLTGFPIGQLKRVMVLSLFILGGCSAFIQPAQKQKEYIHLIKDWQERIQKQGWSEVIIRQIIKDCVYLSKYVSEKGDHWQTPDEFILNGFRGDCEDFAAFEWGVIKRLGCPYPVRMAGVATAWPTDHAVLRVRLPAGWKTFESVPIPGHQLDGLFYRRFVEWDEKEVYVNDLPLQ